MDPELADLNHALRAIPLYCCAVVSSVCLLCRLWVHALAVFNIYNIPLSRHVHVGWDTPIEFLNGPAVI